VSGVGPGIGALDGVHTRKGRGCFLGKRLRDFSSIGLNGVFEFIRNTETYSTRVSKVDKYFRTDSI